MVSMRLDGNTAVSATIEESDMKNVENTVVVWDPLVRIGHWLLVLAFFTAYFTEDDFLSQHVWAGYTVGTYVVLRVLWGIIGTRNARFSSFVRAPATTLGYIGDLVAGRAKRYVGHNPAGAAMVVALLLSLSATVGTGLVLLAVEEDAGPLAGWVNAASSSSAGRLAFISAAQADDDDDDDSDDDNDEYEGDEDAREEFWEELHELFTNLSLLLVGLHIAGVLFSSHVHRENLIKAMFTGRKANSK